MKTRPLKRSAIVAAPRAAAARRRQRRVRARTVTSGARYCSSSRGWTKAPLSATVEWMSGRERVGGDQHLEQLEREVQRLREENERLKQEIDRLRERLEEALRAAKRQAAPHSRGEPKEKPQKPGRKPGADYGRHACRSVPQRVDEQIAVPLPEQGQHCGGEVAFQRTAAQYQEEIVRRTLVRRFDIALGECQRCGRHIQGRHPLETSDAVGAAAVQLGPEALTLAALMNKQMGLSLGHTRQVLQQGFGLTASRAGLSRALARLADKAAPTYQGLIVAMRFVCGEPARLQFFRDQPVTSAIRIREAVQPVRSAVHQSAGRGQIVRQQSLFDPLFFTL